MGWSRMALILALVVALGGCGNVRSASPPDAAIPDGAANPPDAGAAAAAPTTWENVGAGARVEGGRFQLDFEIGHSASQKTMSGGDKTLHGGAAVGR